jgi:hypothetical protein
MILRNYEIDKYILLNVDNEADFLASNNELNFVVVDSLPSSKFGFYLKNGDSYIVDIIEENKRQNIVDQNDSFIVHSQLIDSYIKFLDDTDHKMNSDYEPTPDEDLSKIRFLRIERRRLIRENKNV